MSCWTVSFILAILLVITFVNFLFMNREFNQDVNLDKILNSDDTPSSLPWYRQDLKSQLQEMLRIRESVGKELRDMEFRWHVLTKELSEGPDKKKALKADILRLQQEVDRTRSLLDQLELIRKDASIREKRLYWRPLPPAAIEPVVEGSAFQETSAKSRRDPCSMKDCFDYSRCPLTSGFSVFLHETGITSIPSLRSDIKTFLNDLWQGKGVKVTKNPLEACLFLVILPPSVVSDRDFQLLLHSKSSTLTSFWNHGRNHLLFNFFHPETDIFIDLNTEQAMIAQSSFRDGDFRRGFDIKLHVCNESYTFDKGLSCPARKKFLVASQFVINEDKQESNSNRLNQVVTLLKKLQRQASNSFNFTFTPKTSFLPNNLNQVTDINLMKHSTFYIFFDEDSIKGLSHPDKSFRLLEYSLRSSSIPVMIGYGMNLPFSEVIDWSKACILLPPERLPEVYLILKSISDVDILEMKRWGRIFYDRYLQDISRNFLSVMALIRQKRLMIPAEVIPDVKAHSYFNSSHPMKLFNTTLDGDSEDGASREYNEFVGAVEPTFPSESFTRNLSLVLTAGYDMWNSLYYDPFYSYPFSPFDPVAPSEAKFIGSEYGFRPIAGGEGAAGPEFAHSLGGNVIREQFTIVMLTYERESVLLDTLQRLKGVPYMNKVIVVWNHPILRPEPGLTWPNIGVPIIIIMAEKNSLNNRFIPFDEIETEAILSLDDDTQLRPDEIVFGFRQVLFFFFMSFLSCFLRRTVFCLAIDWSSNDTLFVSFSIQSLERSKRQNCRVSWKVPFLGSTS